MKLRRRRPAGSTYWVIAAAEPRGRAASPAGAVTSWLRQGLANGICPLCRVAHKADREYIWHFYDEQSNDMGAVEEVRRAFGFCAEHIEMLRRIDVEDMKTTLSISVLFADTFTGIVEQLQALSPDAAFEPAPCPACASRDEYLHRNAAVPARHAGDDPRVPEHVRVLSRSVLPPLQAHLAARPDAR